jgi:hypothetical protein
MIHLRSEHTTPTQALLCTRQVAGDHGGATIFCVRLLMGTLPNAALITWQKVAPADLFVQSTYRTGTIRFHHPTCHSEHSMTSPNAKELSPTQVEMREAIALAKELDAWFGRAIQRAQAAAAEFHGTGDEFGYSHGVMIGRGEALEDAAKKVHTIVPKLAAMLEQALAEGTSLNK